jgi:isoleucyl-tRNA synthetase
MWLEGDSSEKRAAYETMFYVLRRLTAVLAPFAPHISEKIYANLRLGRDRKASTCWHGPSRHRHSWTNISREMAVVSPSISPCKCPAGRKRKLRWPVPNASLSRTPNRPECILRLDAVCRDRANSRVVKVVEGAWPDRLESGAVMKALGPSFGKSIPMVRAAIGAANGSELKFAIEPNGKATFHRWGIVRHHCRSCDIQRAPAEGIFSAPMKDGTVYVDVTLSPDLEAEGYARKSSAGSRDAQALDLGSRTLSGQCRYADRNICDLIRITC